MKLSGGLANSWLGSSRSRRTRHESSLLTGYAALQDHAAREHDQIISFVGPSLAKRRVFQTLSKSLGIAQAPALQGLGGLSQSSLPNFDSDLSFIV